VVFKSFGEGLEGRNPDKIKLARFDITKNQAIARQLGVASTPSFVIFNEGKELERFFGDTLQKDDIEAYVNKIMQ
jgi:thioredoxin-like negative regulator of GroEL